MQFRSARIWPDLLTKACGSDDGLAYGETVVTLGPILKAMIQALVFSAVLAPYPPAFADCLSIIASKGADDVARQLLGNTRLKLLFLGTITDERFAGDFHKIYSIDNKASRFVTYHVETIFLGRASSVITLRTPFFCEACSYADQAELDAGLKTEIGRRVIVFEWEEIDEHGQREIRVSGGCPDSIDAPSFAGKEDDLVLALRRLRRKQ